MNVSSGKPCLSLNASLVQEIWDLPALRPWWPEGDSELQIARVPSPRPAPRWEPHLPALLTCLLQSQGQVRCGGHQEHLTLHVPLPMLARAL